MDMTGQCVVPCCCFFCFDFSFHDVRRLQQQRKHVQFTCNKQQIGINDTVIQMWTRWISWSLAIDGMGYLL